MNLAVHLPHVASWGRVPDGSGLDVRADEIGRPAVRGLRTCRRWPDAFRWQARDAPFGARGADRHFRRGQNICRKRTELAEC
jgi:hypothetical protein